jgi:hypothetical protein
MYISAKTPPAQYHPITNSQKPAVEIRHASDEEWPQKNTVTISSQAKKAAELDTIRYGQDPDGSRALAYGDLIYVGPPTMSLEEASARMDLWEKYQNTPIMDSFRKDAIDLYEMGTLIGTPDSKIGEQLMSLYEDLHRQLSRRETSQKVT